MVSPNMEVPAVGSRVLVKEKDFGTIKFVGHLHVDGQKSTWLGIDWDDPKRGKHDGSVDGIRYFQASSATSGSFVKPHPSIDTGIDVNDALERQYQADDHTTPGDDEVDAMRRTFNASLYEVVGFEEIHARQKDLKFLSLVDLSGTRISRGKLSRNDLPNVIDLCLSSNLISSWSQLHEMICDLPRLHTLGLSFNRFNFEDSSLPIFRGIKNLAVNACALKWNNFLQIARMFPDLVFLSCSVNHLDPDAKDLELFRDLFPHVEELDISSNSVTTPAQFAVFGNLQSLKHLRAQSLGLDSIELDNGAFPVLSELNLHGNILKNLRSLDELRKIKSLRTIRVTSSLNDVALPHYYRCAVIAKLPQIVKINGTEIVGNDRRDAELDYLRLNAKTWFESAADPSKRKAFLNEHPNYPELIEKYGEPSNVVEKSTSLSGRLLELTIVTPDNPIGNPLKRKLPKDMTVGKLKGALARSCGKQATDLELTACPAHAVTPNLDFNRAWEVMDLDDRALNFYLSGGDVLIVKWQ